MDEEDSAGSAWRVRATAFATPLLALALLGLIVAAAEVAARSGFVRSRLAAPSVGSPSRLFELQLAKLAALVDREGGVDCLFLGNSLVLLGLDPEAFSAAYAARTGERVRSFNFGVGGITVAGVAAIARILAEDYHPWLIIYGLTAADFSAAAEGPAIEMIPWVRYRQGAPTADGWLTDHSYAYRYFLRYGWRNQPVVEPALRNFAAGAPRGFYPFTSATIFDASASARARGLITAQLQHPASERQRAALTTLLGVHDTGVEVALVEMPLHLGQSQWSDDASTPYQGLVAEVARAAHAAGTPFWPMIPPQLVPADGWTDLWHLNARGAEVFGRWLGERVAAAVAAGELPPPRPRRTEAP